MKKIEYLCVFLIGGIIYNLIEIMWRGYTHWSMTIAGGACLLIIHLINQKMEGRSLFWRCAVGCILITTVEFFTGVIVNLIFRLNVWDYSAQPGNVLGQICPMFSILWFFLSLPACLLSNMSRRFFNYLKNREDDSYVKEKVTKIS